MFLCVPRTGIETPFVAKRVEGTLWKIGGHGRTHTPSHKLDSIAGERYHVGFEVVERGDAAPNNDPERCEEPESKGENGLTAKC